MIDPEPRANTGLPWQFDTKQPFDRQAIENEIGQEKDKRNDALAQQMCCSEQDHDQPTLEVPFIRLPILKDVEFT
ncbi:MAG: hypothetical protein ABI373_01000, partial [Flavobacteriales bacterium]